MKRLLTNTLLLLATALTAQAQQATAPIKARAAMLRYCFILFIAFFVLVGSLLIN